MIQVHDRHTHDGRPWYIVTESGRIKYVMLAGAHLRPSELEEIYHQYLIFQEDEDVEPDTA
jgi:hypothetical protein